VGAINRIRLMRPPDDADSLAAMLARKPQSPGGFEPGRGRGSLTGVGTNSFSGRIVIPNLREGSPSLGTWTAVFGRSPEDPRYTWACRGPSPLLGIEEARGLLRGLRHRGDRFEPAHALGPLGDSPAVALAGTHASPPTCWDFPCAHFPAALYLALDNDPSRDGWLRRPLQEAFG